MLLINFHKLLLCYLVIFMVLCKLVDLFKLLVNYGLVNFIIIMLKILIKLLINSKMFLYNCLIKNINYYMIKLFC